jgi:YD repeat-containing protein
MTQEVSPASGTTFHAYNEHGELTSETDARGIVMTRTGDALDRVTAVTYPNPALNIAYTWTIPWSPSRKGA